MKDVIVSFLVGIVSSIVASYIYSRMTNSPFSIAGFVLLTTISGVLAWLVSVNLPRLMVVLSSGITAYYPKGQRQYRHDLVNDLRKTNTLKATGARGLDLLGDRSPVGESIQEWRWQGELEAFLIHPESGHTRLRVHHLEAERDKYQAECRSVGTYLAMLSLRFGTKVAVYRYDARPVFRSVIMDHCAYVSIYQPGLQGRMLPCFRISATRGPLYGALLRHCDYLRAIGERQVYEREEDDIPRE